MESIRYELNLGEGEHYHFDIDIERVYHPPVEGEPHHNWTRLENDRCDNCPLSIDEHDYCPAAIDIESIAAEFGDTLSIKRADVWVHSKNRSYFKNCDAQTCLNSLFGLVMATSGCPLLSRLRPLAHSHQPFASLEETVHRLVGTYLINQYLEFREGNAEPDWSLDGIAEIYAQLQRVNIHLMRRMRAASSEDANINALQTFISISSLVKMGVDDILSRLPPLLRSVPTVS